MKITKFNWVLIFTENYFSNEVFLIIEIFSINFKIVTWLVDYIWPQFMINLSAAKKIKTHALKFWIGNFFQFWTSIFHLAFSVLTIFFKFVWLCYRFNKFQLIGSHGPLRWVTMVGSLQKSNWQKLDSNGKPIFNETRPAGPNKEKGFPETS